MMIPAHTRDWGSGGGGRGGTGGRESFRIEFGKKKMILSSSVKINPVKMCIVYPTIFIESYFSLPLLPPV